MNVLIYGAGAIGGWIGTNLAAIGHTVAFVVRPNRVTSIRANGVPVLEEGERLTAPVLAFVSLAEAVAAHSYDLLILAVKSYHLPAVAADIAAHYPTVPMLLITQNGIGVEQPFIDLLGDERVLTSSITAPVERQANNEMRVTKSGRGLAIAPTHKGQAVQQWLDLFEGSNISAFRIKDYRSMKWSKAMFNLIGNASSAVLDMSPKEIYADPRLFAMERAMFREVMALMRALGIRPIIFGGIPTPIMAFFLRWIPAPITRRLMLLVVEAGRGDKMPSFHIDLSQGKPQSEVLYHNHAIAQMGEALGIPMPVNHTLSKLLLAMIAGEIPRETFQKNPTALLAVKGINQQ